MGFQFASKSIQPALHKSSPRPRKTVGLLALPHAVLQPQRTIGNQGVLRLLESQTIQRKCACDGTCPRCQVRSMKTQRGEMRQILHGSGSQSKLSIGEPGDKYEQEADRVADQVMAMPGPPFAAAPDRRTSTVQRQAEKEEEPLQAKLAPGQRPLTTGEITAPIEALRGGGKPLPASARAFFEPRFGYDLSKVRIYTDSHAQKTAQRTQARAFTVGQNVVFNAGQYAPGTREGRRLLAHELAHVIQQKGVKSQGDPNRAPGGPASLPIPVTRHVGRIRIQRQPVVTAHPASSSVSDIDHSESSRQIGARSGGGVAYGLTHHRIRMTTIPDTRPRRSGRSWRVALWSAEVFPNVDNTIYIASDFPANSCPFTWTLDHEAGHVLDAYAIMVRHRRLLIDDLRSVRPEPNSPIVAGRVAAERARQQIVARVRTLVDCAMSQACYDMYRNDYARDVHEYPRAFTGCPAPRPPVPGVPPRGRVAVLCRPPPQGCPRPIRLFP